VYIGLDRNPDITHQGTHKNSNIKSKHSMLMATQAQFYKPSN